GRAEARRLAPLVPECPRRELVGARCAADAEVDAPGEERLEHAEALGDLQGTVVLQHDAARADADARRARGDLADQHLWARAREPGRAVVLGEPVAAVAPALAGLRELEGLVERVGRGPAAPHRRLVEDREVPH